MSRICPEGCLLLMGGRCEEPGSPEEPWPPEQLSQTPDQSGKSRLDSGQKRSATPDIQQGGESKQQQPLAALIWRRRDEAMTQPKSGSPLLRAPPGPSGSGGSKQIDMAT